MPGCRRISTFQTVTPGNYYQLSEACNVRDTNGAYTESRQKP